MAVVTTSAPKWVITDSDGKVYFCQKRVCKWSSFLDHATRFDSEAECQKIADAMLPNQTVKFEQIAVVGK